MTSLPEDSPDPANSARWLRTRAALDQRDLANRANLPVAAVNRFDNRGPITREEAAKLSEALAVRAEVLFAWSSGGPDRLPRAGARHDNPKPPATPPGPFGETCVFCPSPATTWDHAVPQKRGHIT